MRRAGRRRAIVVVVRRDVAFQRTARHTEEDAPIPHALLVEDDANALTSLSELVAREGFTVSSAATLQEARTRMAERRPDVVLLDLYLPDGYGMDLFEDVKSRATTEVILITGHASLESSIEALRLGAADYLIKPVNVKQLKAILSRV